MRGKEKLQWVFFTDLDGTLLDHATYKWTRARRALTTLRRRGIPLVIVTSKTRAEVLGDASRSWWRTAERFTCPPLTSLFVSKQRSRRERVGGDWSWASRGIGLCEPSTAPQGEHTFESEAFQR